MINVILQPFEVNVGCRLSKNCPCGGIGRRSRLKTCLPAGRSAVRKGVKACRFDSFRGHAKMKIRTHVLCIRFEKFRKELYLRRTDKRFGQKI